MKFKVDGWNNFCRVFELPKSYSNEYCFGGGHATNFQMVDWFNPIQGLPMPGCDKKIWLEKVGSIEIKQVDYDELVALLNPWLILKNYVKPDHEYLVICDFGATFIFNHRIPE